VSMLRQRPPRRRQGGQHHGFRRFTGKRHNCSTQLRCTDV
jgi:hypothetical protein